MLGEGEKGQDKQVEKGGHLHPRKTEVILGGVEVEDSVVVRLGPVSGAKRFNPPVKPRSVSRVFPVRTIDSRCWRRCSAWLFLFTPSDTGTSPS